MLPPAPRLCPGLGRAGQSCGTDRGCSHEGAQQRQEGNARPPLLPAWWVRPGRGSLLGPSPAALKAEMLTR